MENRLVALGIITIVISSLVVGIAVILMSIDNTGQDTDINDQEIIGDKFLYYHGINITWFGEAAFRIISGDLAVYIDPYVIPSGAEIADIIISTHTHGEHLSLFDIVYLSDADTTLYTPKPNRSIDGIGPNPEAVTSSVPGNVTFSKPGMVVNHSNTILEFVPAYNIDKYNYNIPGQLWHPPWANWTGVIVEIDGTRIYHPGDSDHIPEMEQIDCDIFLAPVGGVGVMTSHEAADAVESLKITSDLKYAVPMHYGYIPTDSPIGPSANFAAEANCTVVILKPV
ncbi:MAG: MBL fold metallo-hydrolase [Candidatus Heimdallarchaeota archaeon]